MQAQAAPVPESPGFFRTTWKEMRRSKLAMIGLSIVTVLILAAVAAPWIAPYNPLKVDREVMLQLPYGAKPPSWEHWFGTDHLGRDLMSRIIYGAQISLQVGIIAEFIAVLIGVTLGSLSGYYGGKVDTLIMRMTDILLAFPTPLLAIAAMAVTEPSINNIFIVLGLIGWTTIARIIRGQVLSVREKEYTEAARALGAGDMRILVRHVIPNSLAPVIVAATMGIAGNILTEAWLSFLGLGAQPPTPSWGSMITEGQPDLSSRPWICFFPGIAIMITVLGFNLLGDGLRDALDPKLRK